ncbi:poly(A) polymerase type 3-like [Spodoptera frugiperda]|uniref:Poly(A) polymerase n=1 Tax=Spodoptera frugiperda TaxID=7108 RepID=A0A9R0EYA0_SPOFR|nr:poly(A) polymerase type 3-like [Spodoptera frugiperda]
MYYTWDEDTDAETPALILSGATPIAKEKTNELKKYLNSYKAPESREQVEHRWIVFNDLQQLVRTWIREESMKQGMSDVAADSIGGNVFPYGCYKMGVNMDDIDALCFAPRNIQRADFFTSFYNILNDHPKVTDLRVDGSSFIPQIKMKFCEININIPFANLGVSEVPTWLDLHDDMVVKDLDLDCVRSLNMYRLTDELLQLVPDVNNFRLTLRVIILWAKRRRIYSKALGYLHDVSLAILVAHTCQQYPNALPAILVHKFFLTLNQWKWPQPILLKDQESLDFGFPVWDPTTNIKDLFHQMPIITPVYPEYNANSNMCEANRSVVMEEIRIGLATTDDIMSYQCGWDKLFEDTKFFSRYEHYVVVLASSTTPDDELEWSELVESKISVLVDSLDRHHQIVIPHLNPECYSSVCSVPLNNNEQSPASKYSMWFVGLVFEKTAQHVDVKYETDKFTSAVLSQAANSNIRGEGKTIAVRHTPREELHHYLPGSLLPRRHASCKPSARSAARATLRRAKRPSETNSMSVKGESHYVRNTCGPKSCTIATYLAPCYHAGTSSCKPSVTRSAARATLRIEPSDLQRPVFHCSGS